jgi:thiol-disulfide isomerase/thioredoxin
MRSKLVAIFMLITFPGLCLGQALTPKEIFNSASKSIVFIVTGDANGKPLMQGSGVAFGGGLVLTNCHVLEDAYSVAVETQGKAYAASRLRNDKDRDLCSLMVAGLPSPKVRIGSVSNLSIGDKVYAIGAPRGLELTFTDGLVSSIRTGQILQTTAAISPGSSGGGLFDEYGQLVGITTLTLKDSQGLNFAVPVEWATALASNQSGVPATQDRSEDEIEIAKAQLNNYEKELRASDPDYEKLRPKLFARASEIVKKYPASQWLAMTKLAYAGIREEWDSADVTAAQADAAATAAEAAAQGADAEADEIKMARAQLNDYEKQLRASDPDYEYLKSKLYAVLPEILKGQPSSQWLARTKQAYAVIRQEWESAQASADAAAQAADAVANTADADDALNLTTIDGENWSLASRRGHWVVVNFWATWCEPCLKVMSELSALDLVRDHVEVIGLDYEDIKIDALKTFMLKHPVAYPISIVDVYDPPRYFEVPRGLPNTYLIAPDGTIAKHFLGQVTAKDIKAAIAEAGNPHKAG